MSWRRFCPAIRPSPAFAHSPTRASCRWGRADQSCAMVPAPMSLPLHVFREYDIRGLVANELTPEFAEQLGRGFGRYLLEKNPSAQSIVLGRDHRTSSEGLAAAFSRGVRSYGVEVVSIGVVPTPNTYFAAHALPVDGLRMITGSHNPPE